MGCDRLEQRSLYNFPGKLYTDAYTYSFKIDTFFHKLLVPDVRATGEGAEMDKVFLRTR